MIIAERFERVHHGERAAIGEADDVDRRPLARAAPCFPDGEPRRGHPVLPLCLGEARGDGAMPGQPNADRDEAVLPVEVRDVPQAVGTVGQAMKQHDRAPWRAVRLEDVAAVPVLGKARRIDQAAGDIAAELRRSRPAGRLHDLGADVPEQPLLGRHRRRPVRPVDRIGRQFGRHIGVPGLERQAALRVERPNTQSDHERQRDENDGAPALPDQPSAHQRGSRNGLRPGRSTCRRPGRINSRRRRG